MFRIITFLICFSVMSAQDFRQTVAVFDFEGNGISQLEATTLTNRFRTAAGDAGAMRLIERGMMEEVLQEQGFQQTGCTSDECAVEVGQLLGVQNMIGGSIGKVGDTFTIDVRMVSVQTGESLVTKQTTYAGRVDGLIIEIEILAYEFFGVKVPEQLLENRKIGIPIASSEIIKQKTKLGAILRSTIVPGLGQFYSGKNILGGSFFLSEIALLGLIYSSFNKYSSSTDQYNDLIPIYNSTRDPDMLFDLRILSKSLLELM